MLNLPRYYGFTVKRNDVKYPQEEDYEDWIANANSKGFNVLCHYFELDSKRKLHVHGVALAPKNFYKQNLLFKKMHQRIDEIPSFIDLQRYTDYIQKEFVNTDEYLQKLDTYRIQTMEYPFLN